MAIAFDATSNSGFTENVSSISWSHTCTGSNLLLYVAGHTVIETSSSATYNSVAMTLIQSQVASGGDAAVANFYLKAPATGSNTVSITLSGSDLQTYGGAVSLTEVDQTTPLDASNKAQAATVDVTVVADNSWAIDSFARLASDVVTAGAGQTQRWNATDGVYGMRVAGSTEGPVSAGAVTMNWTGGSYAPAIVAASFKPASAGTAVKDIIQSGIIAFAR